NQCGRLPHHGSNCRGLNRYIPDLTPLEGLANVQTAGGTSCQAYDRRCPLRPTGHDVLLFLVDPPRHNGTDAILSGLGGLLFGLTLDLFSSQRLGLPLNGFFPYLKQWVTLRKVYGRIF
ncbi:MAG: hypothetical protein QOI53_2319, partial [Verrucomicrobiota bacterium]|nr:hypothetical protein [Verrucomicrobiota bacterium]